MRVRAIAMIMLVLAGGLLAACSGGGGGIAPSPPPRYIIPAWNGTPVLEEILGTRPSIDNGSVAGNATAGHNSDRFHYSNATEFNFRGNDHLAVHKFDMAYSRGWTGNGSLIMVLDTGLNVSHPEFAGSDTINLTRNFLDDHDFPTKPDPMNSSKTINLTFAEKLAYQSWHGTAVAGIIAAPRNASGNGTGLHGTAFDADLAIGKVGTERIINLTGVAKAYQWASEINATAINLSFGVDCGATPEERVFCDGLRAVPNTTAEWYSTHSDYSVRGFKDAISFALQATNATRNNKTVLVHAAGNNAKPYSYGLAQMATATNNTTGELILGGQMLIVGMWDTKNNVALGNQAGNVCTTWQASNSTCMDAAKIRDFFILADGAVTSTWHAGGLGDNGNYSTRSGSSYSAPIVAGAVAIIHQMWPHMAGKDIVQLLLWSADKNITGYNPYVHGHGLLDMDNATRPMGAVGVAVGSSTDGGRLAIVGGARLASGISPAQAQVLAQVMLLDEFERDFYLDLAPLVTSTDTRRGSLAETGSEMNYYAGYMPWDKHALLPAVSFGENSSLSLGFGTSEGHVLGNEFSGILGTARYSHTIYGMYHYNYGDGGDGFFAQAGLGLSYVEFDKSNSLLEEADIMVSSTASLGYRFDLMDRGRLAVSISQPVTLESARLTYDVPVARTLEGRVVREARRVDFKAARREIDFGINYALPLWDGRGEVASFAEARTGAIEENRFGVRFVHNF